MKQCSAGLVADVKCWQSTRDVDVLLHLTSLQHQSCPVLRATQAHSCTKIVESLTVRINRTARCSTKCSAGSAAGFRGLPCRVGVQAEASCSQWRSRGLVVGSCAALSCWPSALKGQNMLDVET